jgi:hypothetical protein
MLLSTGKARRARTVPLQLQVIQILTGDQIKKILEWH